MSLRVNTNVEAFNAHRNLSATSTALSKSMEKLSSGLRINRAADDAAGLAISEGMRAQIRGTAQASRNAQDGISLVQTAEGALNEMHSILQRIRELAVQFGNGTLSTSDQAKITAEVAQLTAELVRIRDTSTFNGIALFGASVPAPPSRSRWAPTRTSTRANNTNRVGVTVAACRSAASRWTCRRSTPPSAPSRRSARTSAPCRTGSSRPCEPRRHPGEPERRRVAHPRRGRGVGDGELHAAADPLAVRHRDAGAGQPGAAERALAPPVSNHRIGLRHEAGVPSGAPASSVSGPKEPAAVVGATAAGGEVVWVGPLRAGSRGPYDAGDRRP